MTDRELWVSVFNTVFEEAMRNKKPVYIEGKACSASFFARSIANYALENAPKEKP